MRKILLGIVLLATVLELKGEEKSELDFRKLKTQTMMFDKRTIIKEKDFIIEGEYKEGKFFEVSREKITYKNPKELCTKRLCIKIGNDNFPKLKVKNIKEEIKGQWSFGPAKRFLENSLMKK